MSNRFLKGAAALLFVLALPAPAGAGTQKTFASPEVAVESLVDGLARNDDAAVKAILGVKSDKLLPLDQLSREDRLAFLGAWARGHRILNDGDKVARLELSTGWTLPIPMVRTGQASVSATVSNLGLQDPGVLAGAGFTPRRHWWIPPGGGGSALPNQAHGPSRS